MPSLTPATQPFPRRATPLAAFGTTGEGGGLPEVGMLSDRLLLRKLALLPDDGVAPLEDADGARAGCGVGGFDVELGRRNAAPPTARKTGAPAPASRSSTVDVRLLVKRTVESIEWEADTVAGAAASGTAGSFSLSGDTDVVISATLPADAPKGE